MFVDEDSVDSRSVVELQRGLAPPERLSGPLETPGLRGYKGASRRPPEITHQIQYIIMQHINIILSTDGAAPSPIDKPCSIFC